MSDEATLKLVLGYICNQPKSLHVGVIAVDTAKTEPGEDLPSATMGKREDLEDQLLLKNSLYPDCPGCKAAYLKDPDAKPPYKQLAIIAAVTLINGTSKIHTYLHLKAICCV